MNGLQALHQWESFFDKPAGAWLGFFNAIYWVGTGISYPLAAIVANKYGRLTGVYIGYAFLALGAGLQAGANGDVAFVLARLFVGCASAWFGNCVPLLINEIAYPSHRGICNALFMCGWVCLVLFHFALPADLLSSMSEEPSRLSSLSALAIWQTTGPGGSHHYFRSSSLAWPFLGSCWPAKVPGG